MSALLLDILCLAVLSQWAQIHSAKMHALSLKGMDVVFWSESALKRGACCMSSPVNGPCSNNLWLHTFSALAGPAERELLHMYRSQYVQTYPGGSTGLDQLKDAMAMETRIRLYIRESQTPVRTVPLHDFHHSSYRSHLSRSCLLAEPCVDDFPLKSGWDTRDVPSDNHRLHFRAEEVSWQETLSLCWKLTINSVLPITCLWFCHNHLVWFLKNFLYKFALLYKFAPNKVRGWSMVEFFFPPKKWF